MSANDISRRGLMVVGGLAAVALTTVGSARDAAPAANPNLKLVTDFYDAQNEPGIDIPALLHRYLAPDCKVHTVGPTMETSVVVGPGAEAARWMDYLRRYGAERFGNLILSTWAKGPFVLVEHTNIVVGGPHANSNPTSPMASVFVVKDGKIKDWTDYPLA
jgi:limonene-1,2-epoxide hydrolase